MTYPLASIKSGEDPLAGIWVSLGFSSPGRELDVLHVIGGDEKDPRRIKMGLIPIYLERYDQKLSCYRGADRIEIADSSVTVTLNKVGQDALDLPATLHLVADKPDADFLAAREIFTKMQKYESGKIIYVG